ncbi:MAG: penicillin-binding transpeptidase domain-containing protein [Ignavibacteria bacterium]|nr:penicillin-binding transpeptidase domain-containing protein [Ignavibacteria bacterium]
MINKRFILFLIVFIGTFILLVFKLADYQIKKHNQYLTETISRTEKSEIHKPLRGELYDRNKILIASSIKLYRFYLDKSMVKPEEYDSIFKPVSNVLKISAFAFIDKVVNSQSKIVYLENELDGETYAKLKKVLNENKLSCFGFEEYQKRIYSKEGIAAHVIGYVRKDSDGVDGIEKFYNSYLKGKEGLIYYKKDASGNLIGRINGKGCDAQDGYNLQLTIDIELQQILEEELQRSLEQTKALYGVGIIMEPNTGEILALANVPTFNPSRYFEYNDSVRKNKAISVVYDPGSTFKAVTLATALELGKIDLNEPLFAENGVYQVTNTKSIRDDHKFSYLTPRESFVYSSNIIMAKISKIVGQDSFLKFVYNFGFGSYTGIDLPGEVRGIVTNLKKNDYALLWMAHGYSISVTPIQLATMYASIINGGNLVKPFVVKKIFDSNGNVIQENNPIIIRKVISENTSRIMREIMKAVIEEGTGKKAKLEKVSCGGKTGTAKKYIEKVGYSDGDYVSSFVGFFPVEKPQYLIFIKLDSPKNGYYGGDVAAPVFKRIGDRIWEIKNNIQQRTVQNFETITEKQDKQFPDLTGKSRVSAIEIAKSFDAKIELVGDGNIVQKQVYDKFQNKVTLIFTKNLHEKEKKSVVYVPNVVGLSIREASTKLKASGVKYVVDGTGYVINQSVQPGEYSNSNIVVRLKCQRGI